MTTQTVQERVLKNEHRVTGQQSEVSSTMLFRLGGMAVLVGGVCGAVSEALHPADPSDSAALAVYAQVAQWVHVLMFVGVMVLLLGLPALYLRQYRQAGKVGLVGFVLLFLGLTLLALPHSAIDVMLLPTMVAQGPEQTWAVMLTQGDDPIAASMALVAEPILVFGALVWFFASLRAHVFPVWLVWLLPVAIVLNILWPFVAILTNVGWEPGPVLFYLALAGFGGSLLIDQKLP